MSLSLSCLYPLTIFYNNRRVKERRKQHDDSPFLSADPRKESTDEHH